MSVIYPRGNSNVNANFLVEIQPGIFQFTIFLKKTCHCTADIMIVADNQEIEMSIRNVNFSK